jgi:hypothetical protein
MWRCARRELRERDVESSRELSLYRRRLLGLAYRVLVDG